MRVGRTSPRYQDYGHLYLESTRLQRALCEYFVVIVRLCKQAVLFTKKPFWSQLSFPISEPFESEFGGFQRDLEHLAGAVRKELLVASIQPQQNETIEMSRSPALSKRFSDDSTQYVTKTKTWKEKMANMVHFLNTCSVYNHEKSWKQELKRGTTNWICHDERYRQWKQEKVSSTLWCTGGPGSGKTVFSAGVVEDLIISSQAAVGYFFCRHDEVESLQTRTIIGSIARQIFGHMVSSIDDEIPYINPGGIGTDQILDYLQELLPSNSDKYIIIVDGLDECEKREIKSLLGCLKQLLMSKHVFQVYCSSRPYVFHWAHTFLEPQWKVSMSETSADIEEYVQDNLIERLKSRNFAPRNPSTFFTVREALLKKAGGM